MTTTNIQPGELMIGNLVYRVDRSRDVHLPVEIPLQVLEIGIFESKLLPIGKIPAQEVEWLKIQNCDLAVIPLTEQWLLEFGFVITEISDWYKLPVVNEWSEIHVNIKHKMCELSISKHSMLLNCKYVHSLQNLYWCLTATPLSRENGKGEG